MSNMIYARVLIGKFQGEDVLISRIPIIPTDVPFEFKWIQLPIRFAFARTITKKKSLIDCGLNLENECVSYGQVLHIPVLEKHSL